MTTRLRYYAKYEIKIVYQSIIVQFCVPRIKPQRKHTKDLRQCRCETYANGTKHVIHQSHMISTHQLSSSYNVLAVRVTVISLLRCLRAFRWTVSKLHRRTFGMIMCREILGTRAYPDKWCYALVNESRERKARERSSLFRYVWGKMVSRHFAVLCTLPIPTPTLQYYFLKWRETSQWTQECSNFNKTQKLGIGSKMKRIYDPFEVSKPTFPTIWLVIPTFWMWRKSWPLMPTERVTILMRKRFSVICSLRMEDWKSTRHGYRTGRSKPYFQI